VAGLAVDPAPGPIELRTHGGVTWLPFGHADADTLARAERVLAGDPRWLRRSVTALAPDAEFVLVDTPPGISPWVAQALSMADEVLVTLAPETLGTASLAEVDRFYRAHLRDSHAGVVGYVLNRFDPRRPADRSLKLGLRAVLGERLRCVVHHDAAVQQQLGHRRLAAEACPDSLLVTDLTALAETLVARGDALLAPGEGARVDAGGRS
jgi:cellulose biosynthesis protein BcsQ